MWACVAEGARVVDLAGEGRLTAVQPALAPALGPALGGPGWMAGLCVALPGPVAKRVDPVDLGRSLQVPGHGWLFPLIW